MLRKIETGITVEILYPTEVIHLIENGEKQHKKTLRIKTKQVEYGIERQVTVFWRTGLDVVEDFLNFRKYSFKYETNTEPIPAEQSLYGGTTLQTTTLVIELKKRSWTKA